MRDPIFKKYLETANLPSLLTKLGAQNAEVLLGEIRHFTVEKAEKRDKIVLDYFGEDGVKQIVDAIVKRLTSMPKPKMDAKILDMGAGSGFFTTRVAQKLKAHLNKASLYAMDATPAMLLSLTKKTDSIVPFLGIAENIAGSVREAKKYANVPERFDAVFSTLTLHHCPDVDKVFQSIRQVLKTSGKAVIVDLCTHPFVEFREEMGDLHLGFDPAYIRKAGRKVFSKVTVEKMPGIWCQSSGRCASLFVAQMQP